MKIPMSNRLLAVCNYIRKGDRVADIGCDHGYLGIYLLTNGIAAHMIESNVAQGPLDSAKRNGRKFHVDSAMTFCLSDGAKDIPRDFDVLVCAGMGADTIMSILSAAPWLKEGYRLILQCQSKRPELRQWLYDAGWRISRETLAQDGKFIYTVMEVVYGPGQGITPAQTYITRELLEDASPLLPAFYDRVRRGVSLTVEGMRRSGSDQLPVYETILADLNALEEQIHGNR
jgi:tRNA (adenine22-N1)-methyltransferase